MGLKKITLIQQKTYIARAFTGTDRRRGPPNNHPRGYAETPDSNPWIHLNNDAGKFE
jgi:hypothetical protein